MIYYDLLWFILIYFDMFWSLVDFDSFHFSWIFDNSSLFRKVSKNVQEMELKLHMAKT